MKILHVTPLYYPAEGGAEQHARIVSERLASRGHEVTILTVNAESDRDLYHCRQGRLPENELLNGVHVVRRAPGTGPLARLVELSLKMRGGHRVLSRFLTADGLEMLLRSPRNCETIRSILRSRADVVGTWNWYWPSAFHGYLARRARPFPLVGIPLFHTAEAWAHRGVYHRMIDACDGLIVNTEHERDFVHALSADPPPAVVAGAGIDPADFVGADGRRFRRDHDLQEVPLVGFVGRMIPGKGVDQVVRAMSVVWRTLPDAHLVLAGHRGNPFPMLDELIDALDDEQRTRIMLLPDFAEGEKADLMEALDVLVVPSIGESFGIVYLEAWACGTPVIGSAIGSTECVIDDEADGFLVDPGDPEVIGRAILRLVTDRAGAKAMGERGRQKTLGFHTWERVADRFEELYRHIADDHRSLPESDDSRE